MKESLRQSLSALHALGRIKALSGRLPADEEIDTGGEIAQIMGIYDRAIGEMRAAGEVLVSIFLTLSSLTTPSLFSWLCRVLQVKDWWC